MVKAPGIEMSASIDQKVQQIETGQKQLSSVVEGIIELIRLVDEMPRDPTLLGAENMKQAKQFKNKMKETKTRLRAIAKETDN